MLRMRAIDGIAIKFEKSVNQPNREAQLPMRMRIENQLLYDFFANGLSALESFSFGSYYLGVGIDGKKFPINKKRRKITPYRSYHKQALQRQALSVEGRKMLNTWREKRFDPGPVQMRDFSAREPESPLSTQVVFRQRWEGVTRGANRAIDCTDRLLQ